jgi:hypothetical protein
LIPISFGGLMDILVFHGTVQKLFERIDMAGSAAFISGLNIGALEILGFQIEFQIDVTLKWRIFGSNRVV